jgi:transposase-like protein
VLRGAAMVTVSPDPVRVESQLQAGELACPSCAQGRLGPWGWARPRRVGREDRLVCPRRSRCRGCRVTHVLLSVRMLLRRADWAELIGRALVLKAAGARSRRISEAVGVPRTTVRGWLDRFAERAEQVRAHFTGWALFADAGLSRIDPAGSPTADAVAAVVAAAEAAGAGAVWEFASAVTGGRLLCNTNAPFPTPWNS